MRHIDEHGDENGYYGAIGEDHLRRLAKLEVSRDCEAELAMLLKGAAKLGVIRLDRILPFLNETKT